MNKFCFNFLKVIGPISGNEDFTDSDFHLLESFMKKSGLKEVKDHFQSWSGHFSNENR